MAPPAPSSFAVEWTQSGSSLARGCRSRSEGPHPAQAAGTPRPGRSPSPWMHGAAFLPEVRRERAGVRSAAGVSSTARELDPEPGGAQVAGNLLAVIPLDLDRAVLDRSARPAELLQRGGARLEHPAGFRKPADDGDHLAAAPGALSNQTHDAVCRWTWRRWTWVTRRSDASGIGRVDEAAVRHARSVALGWLGCMAYTVPVGERTAAGTHEVP